MLSRHQRLSSARVRHLFAKGDKAHSSYFTLTYLSSHHPTTQASVVVSKKVHPLAVNRNHLRRQLYQLIKPHLTKSPPLYLIITPKPPAASLSYDQLSKQLSHAFEKIKTNPKT